MTKNKIESCYEAGDIVPTGEDLSIKTRFDGITGEGYDVIIVKGIHPVKKQINGKWKNAILIGDLCEKKKE